MIRRRRQAFTLIEILVVIGIILVLMTIGVLGFQHIEKVGSEKATHARFETCNSILSEYEASVGSITAIEGASAPPAVYVSLTYSNATTLNQCTNPGDVNISGTGRTNATVTTTGTILSLCSHVPAVKTQIAQLPSGAVLALTTAASPPFVILDAWKNPIIYVPSTGLTGVNVGSLVKQTVRSVDGRPFWASAGQDGNFSSGDDNLYSTTVVLKGP